MKIESDIEPITEVTITTFEDIRHVDEKGREYWSARELMVILEYSKWDNFKNVIEKAMEACKNSNYSVSDHFPDVGNMVEIGSKSKRTVQDYQLSRYACYLIVQNADPSKEVVALGQTYFATQTRRQELSDQEKEDLQRLSIRNEMKEHNKKLVDAAHQSGVIDNRDFAIFQNNGYQGLYGGMGAKEIGHYKGLRPKQQILDHMGSTELAANLFRATQTEEKLRREQIYGKRHANQAHYEVGKKVRDTIMELGGTMPEDLPRCEDIKKIERKYKKISDGSKPAEIK
ncbi:MAG: DNA damage-inducible protein D [Negativicutes bacterium]|nr:DNA damage-inducible protein D [Negativicutes bacterium]